MASLLHRKLAWLVGLLALAAGMATTSGAGANPQARIAATTGAKTAAEDPQERKAEREKALDALRAEQKKATERENKLKAEIRSLGENRRELNKALIDAAARIRNLEDSISRGEERLKSLDDREQTVRVSLDQRRAVVAEVLATLQRMGRRPPPALMVAPEDAVDAVRSAILLGAVVPEMRAETRALLADLNELVRIRQEIITERHRSARDILAVTVDRQRMSILVEERQKRQAETEQALKAESRRAADLARQADDLQDLIAKLEKDVAAAARAAQAAANATPAPRQPGGTQRQDLAALRDPGRMAPAVAFSAAKGALPLPVNGSKLRSFGDVDRFGGAEKGISLATRASAQVTAPCDGWVVYAGPFRSYGQLLILNAGGGYHVLLAGMERISVDLGQFVLTGEPVAVMGSERKAAALISIGSSQPVLYIEFRKDGTPVDPSPWWAKHDSEKVRG
jgi:septal ring factor EnvC (AmiA/AmiB activator)